MAGIGGKSTIPLTTGFTITVERAGAIRDSSASSTHLMAAYSGSGLYYLIAHWSAYDAETINTLYS